MRHLNHHEVRKWLSMLKLMKMRCLCWATGLQSCCPDLISQIAQETTLCHLIASLPLKDGTSKVNSFRRSRTVFKVVEGRVFEQERTNALQKINSPSLNTFHPLIIIQRAFKQGQLRKLTDLLLISLRRMVYLMSLKW